MRPTLSLKRGLAEVGKFWKQQRFDLALAEVNRLLEERPDSAQLLVMRAELTQLQDDEEGIPTLEDARKDLERAVALDDRAPNALIELGHFLYAVEDDAEEATRYFQKGVRLCRSLLKEALVGHAKALAELDRKPEALACLVEASALQHRNGKSESAELLELWQAL